MCTAQRALHLRCDLCRRNGPVERAHNGPIQIRPMCDRYGVARARDFGIFRHLRCDRAVQHAVQQCQVAATVHARMLQRGVAGAAELDAGAPPAVTGCNEHEIGRGRAAFWCGTVGRPDDARRAVQQRCMRVEQSRPARSARSSSPCSGRGAAAARRRRTPRRTRTRYGSIRRGTLHARDRHHAKHATASVQPKACNSQPTACNNWATDSVQPQWDQGRHYTQRTALG